MKFGNLLHMLATHNQQFQVLYAAYKGAKKALKRLGRGQPHQVNPDTSFATELVQRMQELATMKANLQQGAHQRLGKLQAQLLQQKGSVGHDSSLPQTVTRNIGERQELSISAQGIAHADVPVSGFEAGPSGQAAMGASRPAIELRPVCSMRTEEGQPQNQAAPAARQVSGSPANSFAGQQAAKDEEEDELHQLYCEAVQFHGELLLNMNWSMLAYTMCLKILKKHNKRTGTLLQAPELRSMLSQPTWSTEEMAQLVCAAEDLVTRIQQELLSREQLQQQAEQQQLLLLQQRQVQVQALAPLEPTTQGITSVPAGNVVPSVAAAGAAAVKLDETAPVQPAADDAIRQGHGGSVQACRPRPPGGLGMALRAAVEQGTSAAGDPHAISGFVGGGAGTAQVGGAQAQNDVAAACVDASSYPPVVRGLHAPVAGPEAAAPADAAAMWVRGSPAVRAGVQAALSPGVQQGQGLQRLLSNMNTSSWDLSEDDEMEEDDMEDLLDDDVGGEDDHVEDGNEDGDGGERLHVGNIGIPVHYSGSAIQPPAQVGALTCDCLSYMSASGSCSPPLGTSPMSDDGIQPVHPAPRRTAAVANSCAQCDVQHAVGAPHKTFVAKQTGEDEATSAAAPKRSHSWLLDPPALHANASGTQPVHVSQRGPRRERVHATGALRGSREVAQAARAAGAASGTAYAAVGLQQGRPDSGARGSAGVLTPAAGSGSDGARVPVHENNAGMVRQMQLALQAWEFLAHNSSTPSTVLPSNSREPAAQQQQQVSEPAGSNHGC